MPTLLRTRFSIYKVSRNLCLSSPANAFGLIKLSNLVSSRSHSMHSHSTVDAEEVAKHSRLNEEWWNPHGTMKALHAMNQIRIPFIRDGIVHCAPQDRTSTPLIGKKLLDVGCGGGILSEPLARLGAEVTGIDASRELIDLAQEHCRRDPRLAHNEPTYCHTAIEDHAPSHENYYDGVIASEIIEHVSDKEVFVKSCLHTLKPGGHIFFTTPNRTRLSSFAGIFLAEYVLNLVPRGTHDYEKFITPTELSFLLERNNCHVQILYGCCYSFVNNKWYFIRNKSLLFALQAVKLK